MMELLMVLMCHVQCASINNSSIVMQFLLSTPLTTTENATNLHSNKVCKSLGRNIIYLFWTLLQYLSLPKFLNWKSSIKETKNIVGLSKLHTDAKASSPLLRAAVKFVISWCRAAWLMKCIFSSLSTLQYLISHYILMLQSENPLH